MTGRRILLLGDDATDAADLWRALTWGGCLVLGPYKSDAEAITEILSDGIDAAVFDLNRRECAPVSVMHALESADKPFLIVTALSRLVLPSAFRDRPRLAKPYFPGSLCAAVARVLNYPRVMVKRDSAIFSQQPLQPVS